MRQEADWAELLQRVARASDRRGHALGIHEREADAQAWVDFYDAIKVIVGGFLQAGKFQPSDADDLVMDVFLRLQDPRLIDRVRKIRSARGYVVAMIRNSAADLARRRMRIRSVDELDLVPAEFTETDDSRLDALREALKKLPASERELLQMRFGENWTIHQISQHLGVRYSAAAVRLSRLVKRLRTILDTESRRIQ